LKPMFEVLAAVDEYSSSSREKDAQRREDKIQTPAIENSEKAIAAESQEKINTLENKVMGMETLLQKIYEQMQSTDRKSDTNNHVEKPQEYSGVLQLFYNNLVKSEVEVDLARKIIDSVASKVGVPSSVNDAASVLYNTISGMLGKPETLKLREDGKPTVVILVGPTGVGKTTTLAKIAANYLLNYKKTVGLITADTFRIAAVEQLKTYAEILGIPVSVIYSSNEITDAINLYNDRDIILIDTAGRSHRNKSQFEELKALVSISNADDIYLVLSATTSNRNCREIISNYGFLKNFKLIFTKIDEAPVAGIILNIRSITGKSLSYITTGQSVPDDIEVANTDRLTKNLLGSIS